MACEDMWEMEEQQNQKHIEERQIRSYTYTLRDHCGKLFTGLHALRHDATLCDVVLCAGRRELAAHRVVLASGSSVFRVMFTCGLLETKQRHVDIPDTSASALELVLDFMYSGSIEITDLNIQELLEVANKYQIASLRTLCRYFMERYMGVTDCLEVYMLADSLKFDELKESAWSFILQHFMAVKEQDGFIHLPADVVIDLCNNKRLAANSEEVIFETVEKWINHNPSRCCYVLRHLRLDVLDLDFLRLHVLDYAFVTNCAHCHEIVRHEVAEQTRKTALAAEEGRVGAADRSLSRPRPPHRHPRAIYVIGGKQARRQTWSVEKYDVVKDKWSRTRCMHIARKFAGAASLGNKLYVVGGQNQQTVHATNRSMTREIKDIYLRSVEVYDPADESWSLVAALPRPQSNHGVCVLNGCLYAIGGEDATQSFAFVDRYCSDSNSWVPVTSMKRNRSAAGVAVLEGKIYVAGGFDKARSTDLSSMEVYDPATGKWTFSMELRMACSGLTMVALNHFLFALGGGPRQSNSPLPNLTAHRFDLLTEEWTAIRSLPGTCAWNSPRACVLTNKIYLMGHYRVVYIYDPDSDTWSPSALLSNGRSAAAVAVL